eukprot:6219557-Amphidinium_carterae.1
MTQLKATVSLAFNTWRKSANVFFFSADLDCDPRSAAGPQHNGLHLALCHRSTTLGILSVFFAASCKELRRENTNILELPTYFAYILRAFSLLEGVGRFQLLQESPIRWTHVHMDLAEV